MKKSSRQMAIFNKKPPSFELVKQQIDTLSTDPTSKLGLRISFLSFGVSLLVLIVFWRKLPPELPLLYSQAYGQSQLVNQWSLWLLPGLSFLINAVSIRWAGMMFETEKLLAQILVWIGTLSVLMATAAVVKVVMLVI